MSMDWHGMYGTIDRLKDKLIDWNFTRKFAIYFVSINRLYNIFLREFIFKHILDRNISNYLKGFIIIERSEYLSNKMKDILQILSRCNNGRYRKIDIDYNDMGVLVSVCTDTVNFMFPYNTIIERINNTYILYSNEHINLHRLLR